MSIHRFTRNTLSKPRLRPDATGKYSTDSYRNFIAAVGRGTGNINDGSSYGFNPLSRNRTLLEYMYRGSWVAGRVIDCWAQDMTREGVTVQSDDDPRKIKDIEKAMLQMEIDSRFCSTLKWSRLYGGAGAFIMIEGQDPKTELKFETVKKGQFKGLLPMDRWLLQPDLMKLVDKYGPDIGLPEYYNTLATAPGMPDSLTIHYTRIIRFEGVELPYWQKVSEMMWGQSVLERMNDRIIAFDSTTTGAAQLVYKAHLRVLKMKNLRKAIAAGGQIYDSILENVNMIRSMQTNEGLTLIDQEDEFETNQYTFSGLDSVLMQFGEQLAGASETPLVRLFGQSPKGFGNGEADLRNHYDQISSTQTSKLSIPYAKVYRLIHINVTGNDAPDGFELDFKPLWEMTDTEMSEVNSKEVSTIMAPYEGQVIDRATVLKELKKLSSRTGLFASITDEMITQAENEPSPNMQSEGDDPNGNEPSVIEGDDGGDLNDDQNDFSLNEPDADELGSATLDDAAWSEHLHPRDETGKFGEKGKGTWTKLKDKLGSNEGGLYDFGGKQYYVKFYKNVEQAKSEVLAAQVINGLGVKTLQPQLGKIGGRTAVITPWQSVQHIAWQNGAVQNLTKEQRVQLAQMYYAAVLTKNWDVLGLDYSNIGMLDGNLVQLDTGGSFKFRAQGGAKEYGPDIAERDSLMNPTIPSGKVFSELKKIDLEAFKLALSKIEKPAVAAAATAAMQTSKTGASLAASFGDRYLKLLTVEKVGFKAEPAKPPKPVKPIDPSKHRTIHQRLRDTMRAAYEADGPKASRLVAETIKAPPPPVTLNNVEIVEDYVGSSGSLNNDLRQLGGAKPEGYHSKHVEVLDEMMKQARDYAIPIRVIRGIPNSVVHNAKIGDTFIDHGYSSTTFSKEIARAFGKQATVLHVTLPKGFKFLSVPSFAKAVGDKKAGSVGSLAMKEAEAILPRSTAYKITKIENESSHRIMHVEVQSSSIQPPGSPWVSTRAAKLKAKGVVPSDKGAQ